MKVPQFAKSKLLITPRQAAKENDNAYLSLTSVNFEPKELEKKPVEKHATVRTSLLSVTAPFRQRQENSATPMQPARPSLIKKLNMQMVVNDQTSKESK